MEPLIITPPQPEKQDVEHRTDSTSNMDRPNLKNKFITCQYPMVAFLLTVEPCVESRVAALQIELQLPLLFIIQFLTRLHSVQFDQPKVCVVEHSIWLKQRILVESSLTWADKINLFGKGDTLPFSHLGTAFKIRGQCSHAVQTLHDISQQWVNFVRRRPSKFQRIHGIVIVLVSWKHKTR